MGRLGIILAFLLSLAAAGGSYYLYQGWIEERTIRSDVEAKYDQVKEKMITVQSEKEQIKTKSEEYRTKAEAMQGQLEKLQADQSRFNSEKSNLEKQLKSHQAMIAELQTKMAELEKKAKDAQAACGVTPADLKPDPFLGPQSSSTAAPAASSDPTPLMFKSASSGTPADFVNAGSESAVAGTEVRSFEANAGSPGENAVIENAQVSGPSVAEIPATGMAETLQVPGTSEGAGVAKILTVNRKFNFVVINQGLQEGLKMGDRLKVLKQGEEVATVQVEKLYDKFSAATLVEEDPNRQVVEGDEARRV